MICARPPPTSIRLTAAAALLGAAIAGTPALAQEGYRAVLVGTGQNVSAVHRGVSAPPVTGFAPRIVGSGQNQSVTRVGEVRRSLAWPGDAARPGSGYARSRYTR